MSEAIYVIKDENGNVILKFNEENERNNMLNQLILEGRNVTPYDLKYIRGNDDKTGKYIKE